MYFFFKFIYFIKRKATTYVSSICFPIILYQTFHVLVYTIIVQHIPTNILFIFFPLFYFTLLSSYSLPLFYLFSSLIYLYSFLYSSSFFPHPILLIFYLNSTYILLHSTYILLYSTNIVPMFYLYCYYDLIRS